MDEKTVARFWSKVDRRGPDECWPWRAGRHWQGYGQFKLNGKKQLAHRVAFFIAEGMWPEPNALHTCDNPPCCNRAHLFEGSQADNMRDMSDKHRAPGGSARGTANGSTRLTVESVIELRALCVAGVSQSEVARRLGVGHTTVWRAVHRKTWAHVE